MKYVTNNFGELFTFVLNISSFSSTQSYSGGCNTDVFSIHPWSLGPHLPAGQTMSTAVGIVWFLEPTFLYVPLYTHLYFFDGNFNFPKQIRAHLLIGASDIEANIHDGLTSDRPHIPRPHCSVCSKA